MILVTVGTQLPFDRLIRMVDELAPDIGEEVFAQVGSGRYTPTNMAWCRDLPADAFSGKLQASSVVVSHAGIGTVMQARRWAKPIILVPRRAAFSEHRSDHQAATARQLRQWPGIAIAETGEELRRLLTMSAMPTPVTTPHEAGATELQAFIRTTILAALAHR